MTIFSPTDAALSGFRYIGRRPLVVLAWAGVFLGYELIFGALLTVFAGDKRAAIQNLVDVNRTDPEAALAMLPSLSFVFLLTTLAALALSSVMFTAAYRAFLKPEDSRFAYLRLGRDEVRMAVLIVATAALDAGGLFLIAFVTGSLAGLGAALPIFVQLLYFPILVVGAICALTWPAIRLSLAMPMTLADHHIRMFESWKPTHGHFWKLISAYLLSAILAAVVVLSEWAIVAVLAAIVIVSFGLSREDVAGLFSADTSSLRTYFSATSLIGQMLNAIAFAVGLTIIIAPVANAYQAFVGAPTPPHGHPPAPEAAAAEPAPPVEAATEEHFAIVPESDDEPAPEEEPSLEERPHGEPPHKEPSEDAPPHDEAH